MECPGGTWCDCAHRVAELATMTEAELGEFYYQNRHRLDEFFEEASNDPR